MGLTAFGIYAGWALLAVSGATQYIDLEEGWSYQTQGPWEARVDHRGLLAMHHPWQPGIAGNFAMATRDVTVPAGWQGRIRLTFYTSDDYHTLPDDPAAKRMAADGFIGHRRRQVFVNDELVWSMDVSDPVHPGESPYVHVDLPAVSGGDELRIALVAFDTEASTVRTREDYYRPPRPGMKREDDPDSDRFRTTVYWGDLALVSGETDLAARPRPSATRVLELHNRTWPPEPDANAWDGRTVELEISAPSGVPKPGFPVEMGIPLPEGAVTAPDGIRLRHRGRPQYAQKTVSATWPDGSLRWVQVRFPVTTSAEPVSLAFRSDTAGAPADITVEDAEEGPLRVDTGRVAFEVKRGDPLSAITWQDETVVETVRLSQEVAGSLTPGTCDRWRVVEQGPFWACVALDGRFEGLDRARGGFTMYVSVYRNFPYVKIWLRVYNETDADLDLSHLRLEFVLPDAPDAVTLPHGAVEGDFVLSQREFGAYSVGEERFPARKPVFAAWANAVLVVRHFRALFPKAVTREGNVLALDLFAGDNRPVTLTPGEAKSHEIWLGLGELDGAALAGVIAQPPVLQNADYYCASGVFGPAAPLDPEGPYARFLETTYGGKSWADLGQARGVRHFPDGPYLENERAWANNYNGRMMGLWGTWLMTGDRAWFDRATDVCAHLQDVAIVHTEVPGKDWLGAMHGPGANHVSGPWNPMLRAEGLALYGHLTGNPDARAEFLGVADYCVRTGTGTRGANARHVAGPFASICAAYRETGELGFLEAGAARLGAMAERVDPRRGVWYDWHGSESYPGTVPWMAAQLAGPLYTWYRMTGDVEAAQLLVGLADALVCENTPWEEPGAMRTFSPNPRYPSAPALDPFVIPVLCAAYELTEDKFYREAARAQWARWQAAPEFQPVFNLSWHWPWLNACVERELAPHGQGPESE